MIGYGADRPVVYWPDGARIAVQFVLNYEEGGENCVLHGDGASEAFLSEIVGAQPWPDQRHWNMESIYEYGARSGFWRLRRLFREYQIPVTVYGVASALARSPEQVRAMQDAGWEIASHGLKWIDYKDHSPEEETADMAEAIRLHTEVTGAAPRGWYTGRCSENTVRLAAQTGAFDYVSDSYDDDLPHWVRIDDHDQLIIPYTLDCNDMRFATPQGFNAGDQFFTYLKDTFDTLYEEGGQMMSIGLHCRLIGRPGRIAALKRFLDYIKTHNRVWCARRIDIAEHWRVMHPPHMLPKPSQLNLQDFVKTYGGIYEHSPWIAERAWHLELGPAHDTAIGLGNALARVFRSATNQERLVVLRSHPDLAGKLAAARRLTTESSAEQASAGLDALTDTERAYFERLNEDYTRKHGFPFIIAVRDHTKSSILKAFEQRTSNDTATEFETACKQVERIAEIRLESLL